MVKAITGGTKILYHPDGPDGEAWEIDFTPPFKRLDLMDDLAKELGVKLPDPEKLDTAGSFASMLLLVYFCYFLVHCFYI